MMGDDHYHGEYEVRDGMLHVTGAGGQRSAKLIPTLHHELLARFLLLGLVNQSVGRRQGRK